MTYDFTSALSLEQQFLAGISDSLMEADASARMPLRDFVDDAWPILEPDPFVEGVHVDAICTVLEAVTDGEIQNLLVNVGPRHTKSTIVSVIWPAWEWGPCGKYRLRYLFTSHADSLAIRDSVKCRLLIESDWYRRNWGHQFKLSYDQNQKRWFVNTRGGVRFSVPLGAKITGHGGDRVICDDPHDVKARRSKVKIAAEVDAWCSDVEKRVNHPRKSARVVIAQRVTEKDLSAELIERGYHHLNLPTEFEPENRCRVFRKNGSLLWEDPRQEPGELLSPGRFPAEIIQLEKRDASLFSALHQQRPTSQEGDLVKRVWFRYWMRPGDRLPPVQVRTSGGVVEIPAVEVEPDTLPQAQSWDFAFKALSDSSYVVGQVWAWKKPDAFLLHMVRRRMSFVDSRKAMIRMSRDFPRARRKLVEEKANGSAILSSLQTKIAGLVPVNPGSDSKLSRAEAMAIYIESSNVFLPHPSLQPEAVSAFISEWCGLPDPPTWDCIDASSQFLARLHPTRQTSYTWGRRVV